MFRTTRYLGTILEAEFYDLLKENLKIADISNINFTFLCALSHCCFFVRRDKKYIIKFCRPQEYRSDKKLIGSVNFFIRLLEQDGYHVLQVPHWEWDLVRFETKKSTAYIKTLLSSLESQKEKKEEKKS